MVQSGCSAEDNGDAILLTCVKCGHGVKALYKDELCKFCWYRRDGEQLKAAPRPAGGAGTELKQLVAELGIKFTCAACDVLAYRMDASGIAWVRKERAQIAQHLKEKACDVSLVVKLMAAARGWKWLSLTDPFGSMVDEAIRRAEIAGHA